MIYELTANRNFSQLGFYYSQSVIESIYQKLKDKNIFVYLDSDISDLSRICGKVEPHSVGSSSIKINIYPLKTPLGMIYQELLNNDIDFYAYSIGEEIITTCFTTEYNLLGIGLGI